MSHPGQLITIIGFTLALALPLAACGSGSSSSDAGSAGDARAALHGCATFTDMSALSAAERMIMVPMGTNTFDFPCVSIRSGQSVSFMWDFAVHPLGAGVAPGMSGTGTTPTPIQPQSSGIQYDVTFPSAGDYPFYCTTHFASGMVGVVRVVP